MLRKGGQGRKSWLEKLQTNPLAPSDQSHGLGGSGAGACGSAATLQLGFAQSQRASLTDQARVSAATPGSPAPSLLPIPTRLLLAYPTSDLNNGQHKIGKSSFHPLRFCLSLKFARPQGYPRASCAGHLDMHLPRAA